MNVAIDKMQELWISVCSPQDITPGTGVCALVGGRQVALFCCRQTQTFYAIDNFDPIGRANVLSRGIMGSIAGEPVVASPLYKHYFNLNTGRCIQTPEHQLKTYPVRIFGAEVQIGINH
ncbi:nitrite reductase small subunit NirD [Shewanella marisflavi]|uniref:nitrite reductase small subunit NirD n=1 Tax=Shewanella marisflavi TaxID=260364 RepID=UPI00200E6A8B|nr:nitrite reductase small subunit NirD [Shewanella marisflavi]MCL1042908.1 nitrite reductase small subunit NirD [Shewanella marisflavi]